MIIISEKDLGIYNAMNKGIELATGDIIGFLNSDDVFIENDVLFSIVKTFENQNIDIVYGNINYVNQKGKIIRKWISGNQKSFSSGWHPPHPAFYPRTQRSEPWGQRDWCGAGGAAALSPRRGDSVTIRAGERRRGGCAPGAAHASAQRGRFAAARRPARDAAKSLSAQHGGNGQQSRRRLLSAGASAAQASSHPGIHRAPPRPHQHHRRTRCGTGWAQEAHQGAAAASPGRGWAGELDGQGEQNGTLGDH